MAQAVEAQFEAHLGAECQSEVGLCETSDVDRHESTRLAYWSDRSLATRKTSLLATRQSRFFCVNFEALFPQVESKPAEDGHVYVRHPNQREPSNQIATPIRKQKFVSRDDQEDGGDVVAETVFASEKVKEFALEDEPARFAVRDAEVMEFSNDFFMRDGPGNGCNGKGNDKQRENL